jgi:Protein of unknown function (DUF3373)
MWKRPNLSFIEPRRTAGACSPYSAANSSRRGLNHMRKFLIVAFVLAGAGLWAQSPPPPEDTAQLRQEVDQLKKTISTLEQRLSAQEKSAKEISTQKTATDAEKKDTTSVSDLQADVKDINERVRETERKSYLDRLNWSGDYRFEAHSIRGDIPAHYDGMQLQNLVVRTLWTMTPTSQGGLGMSFNPAMLQMMTPAQFKGFLDNQVGTNYGSYQFFTNNLTFDQLKQAMGQFPASLQQQLMGYLMQAPGVLVNGYSNNTDMLYTNRLRLRFNTKVADNVSVDARLSMYKVFGDSTGVQVFNGQPDTLNIDGTTAGVPSGDMLRVERAYFNWTDIGGSKLYLSIGRRPATGGPPLNFRQDELRGGTPMGSLFDYQYDGMTLGYHLTPKMTLRACYGVGYSAGFGNGNLLKTPADRLKDVHLAGGVLDLDETDKTFVQALIAHAWNVTDGFNGQVVLPNNPVTGDVIGAPVIMRFTPSANLGGIYLYGLTTQKTLRSFDLFASANWSSLRPNGVTTPFGGLGSDPFQTPVNHDGQMYWVGIRYNIPKNDGRTKIGFEFNHGTKYWFNFANAEDDIIMPKTQTRGDVFETYATHRINDHFIFKADFIRYNYTWSGSGWHLGQPKRLDSIPLLGFPTYDVANMFTMGITARF